MTHPRSRQVFSKGIAFTVFLAYAGRREADMCLAGTFMCRYVVQRSLRERGVSEDRLNYSLGLPRCHSNLSSSPMMRS